MNFWKFNFKKGAGVWVIKKNPNPLKNPQSQLTKQKEKKKQKQKPKQNNNNKKCTAQWAVLVLFQWTRTTLNKKLGIQVKCESTLILHAH